MRTASTDHHCRIVGDDIGPLQREPGELPRLVAEVANAHAERFVRSIKDECLGSVP